MARVPFTLRKWQVSVAFWAILSPLIGLAGPFGTHDALGLGARTAYWAAVVGAAVLLAHAMRGLDGWAQRRSGWRARMTAFRRDQILNLIYAAGLSSVVWGLNATLFDGWTTPLSYLWLFAVVLAVVLAIHAGLALLGRGRAAGLPQGLPGSAVDADPAARFLRNLPPARRAPLVRIEAQDHYLVVVTDAGQATILMRMGDAEADLPVVLGVRVHRSHWVARGAVTGRRREGDRVILLTSDGATVPVSRGYRKAAQAAGLI